MQMMVWYFMTLARLWPNSLLLCLFSFHWYFKKKMLVTLHVYMEFHSAITSCVHLSSRTLCLYIKTLLCEVVCYLLLSNPFWACSTEDLWWILSCRGLDIFLCCLQNRNGHLWVTSAWCTYLFLWKKNAIWRPWLIFHSNCYLRRVDGSISGVWALKLSVP
jgi:hypothetical protein